MTRSRRGGNSPRNSRFGWALLQVSIAVLACVTSASARPRYSQPPWPWPWAVVQQESFDEGLPLIPSQLDKDAVDFSGRVESWSGLALQRTPVVWSPLILPGIATNGQATLPTGEGA